MTDENAKTMYAGQEAVAVGAVGTLQDIDIITSTHRGHGRSCTW